MQANILDLVEKIPTGDAKKKDTLTQEEIKLLSSTPINSSQIKRAALFSYLTGLAWVDIKQLTWDKIKLDSKILEMVRSKLKNRNRTVTIPLNETAIKLLELPGEPNDLVFTLPSADGANKTLKAWVKRAGIKKSITWHNLRHSYGSHLILNEVDLLSTSSLMGHGSTSQTLRYVTAAEELKQRGTDKLNFEL